MRSVFVSLVVGVCIFTHSVSSANARGDMDCDGVVGLAEAIIALQVLTGVTPAVDLSLPCEGVGTRTGTPVGYIEWNGVSVDYRGSITAHLPGCNQDVNGIYWDYDTCRAICGRIGPGGSTCRNMCSNIFTVTNNDPIEICTEAPTITEPQPGNIELGRLELNSDDTLTAVGTVTSSIMGCRQDNTGIYWSITPCLADCSRLAAGGVNCRQTCYFMRDDPLRNDIAYCTY